MRGRGRDALCSVLLDPKVETMTEGDCRLWWALFGSYIQMYFTLECNANQSCQIRATTSDLILFERDFETD